MRKALVRATLAVALLSSSAVAQVVPGLEVLVTEKQALISGKRVGLVTNHTGVDREVNYGIDLIARVPGVKLVALFAPEHGIRGMIQAGDLVQDSIDNQSGAPVYSIYGATQRPTARMLKGVDILLFDIQDIGVRFYTYISTMRECMEAAAEQGVPFVVLDRPNVLADTRVEGQVLIAKYRSFVGAYPIPIRFGLTLGELAGFYRDRMTKKVALTVVTMKNWKRSMWYDQTGLPWVPPSPNIPAINTAVLYPGTCLIEGTNVSEGRGTTTPFETIGAPWIDGFKLADELRKLGLPGVLFRPTGFTPTFSKHQGQGCFGVQILVTDRSRFEPVRTGLYLLRTIKVLWPDKFQWRNDAIDRLSGSDELRRALDSGDDPEKILAGWAPALKEYDAARRKYFLYE